MEKPDEENTPKKESLSAFKMEDFFPDPQHMEDMIKQTMSDMLKEKKVKRRLKSAAEIDAMVNVCSEFMNSFVILGYNTRNEAIEPVYYCSSEMEADALSNYLQKFFLQSVRPEDRDRP